MSERKVLTKYYPPDFDPRKLERVRGPKQVGPKVQTVRLMAPFSMKCTSCGEYIYKGRKFNARKETPEGEKYLGIQIFRFYIRCTRCSSEITFKTDPKHNDYTCERGAKRSTEPWRMEKEETDEERLDRLQAEEEERNAMVELEAKTVDAKREMAVADALDEIRTRNARLERADRDGVEVTVALPEDDEEARVEREIDEAAKAAFAKIKTNGTRLDDEIVADEDMSASTEMPPPPLPSAAFKREKVVKKTGPTILGIKKKTAETPAPVALTKPAESKKSLTVNYGSDSE
jgi:hypothetical protein